LIRLASEVGLDAEEVSDTLTSGAFADEVRADEREAREHGINGVPCFVFIGRYAVSGAQAPETLLAALERAWSEHSAKPIEFGEGAVCGPDGC
jgi:predicted DsbA family dithiol-disulfide isomerase